MAYKKAICIVCGEEFYRRTDLQRRCPKCQAEYRKQMDRDRYYTRKDRIKAEKEEEMNSKAAYINGQPQLCKKLRQCFYGSELGCSYIQETGQSRINHGLYIVDGVCPAFTPKGSKKMKRTQPVTFHQPIAIQNYREV